MTHNEERTHWLKEGAIGLGVGVLYGVTNVCVGHPFDTIKTKMQAQAGFERNGMAQTFLKTLKTQGLVGLYRGCIPPLWGSGIFRSAQFAVFEGVYTYLDNDFGKAKLPLTAGLQVRVILGGAMASTCRAIIETPLEYAKIRRQTQQSWKFRALYTGFGVTWCRTMGLMGTYFILLDSSRRHCSELFKRPLLGPFMLSGVAATLAWWIVWPLEYMKSQVQGNYGKYDLAVLNLQFHQAKYVFFCYRNIPVVQRMRLVIKEKGSFFALYRGLGPGTIRSFLANGTSMIVMQWAQRKVSKLGLRD